MRAFHDTKAGQDKSLAYPLLSEFSVGTRSGPSHHVLCDPGLADPDAELQELAVDTRRTPERLCAVHLPDQLTNFARY
jgi:hypothetical protein